MSRHPYTAGPLALLTRARAERRARRELEQELAGYATPADRDGLGALVEQSGLTDDDVAGILRSQAQAQLFRVA
jgi:hypothetical protein